MPGIHNKVAVVGAGIAGLLLAHRLCDAGYEVVVYDKLPGLFGNTSAIISEMHAGGEYPYNAKSGTDCLDGLLEFAKYLPHEVFPKGRTVFFVSNKDPSAVEQMRKHVLEVLKSHYAALYEKNRDKPEFAEIFAAIGTPDQAFYEDKPDKYPQVQNVAAAFVTPQRGFNISMIAMVLKKRAEEKGIVFKFQHEVKKVRKEDNGIFKITTENLMQDTVEEAFSAVAFAANFDGGNLTSGLNPEYRSGAEYANLREITVVNTHLPPEQFVQTSKYPNSDEFFPATCFTMLGDNGGMLSPVGLDENGHVIAIIYHPSKQAGHISSQNHINIRSTWQIDTRHRYTDSPRAQHALTSLGSSDGIYHPLLHKATVISTHHKIAINATADVHVRTNPGSQTVVTGCEDLSFTTKATTTALNAKQATEKLLAYSLSQGHITLDEYQERIVALQTTTLGFPQIYKEDPETFFKDTKKQATDIMQMPEGFARAFKGVKHHAHADQHAPAFVDVDPSASIASGKVVSLNGHRPDYFRSRQASGETPPIPIIQGITDKKQPVSLPGSFTTPVPPMQQRRMSAEF